MLVGIRSNLFFVVLILIFGVDAFSQEEHNAQYYLKRAMEIMFCS
jgi:hypothetical protein